MQIDYQRPTMAKEKDALTEDLAAIARNPVLKLIAATVIAFRHEKETHRTYMEL